MTLVRSMLSTLMIGVLVLVVAAASNAPPGAAALPYLRGQLLVATPAMPDPRFAHAVIYMVEHNAKGAFGLIINRPLGVGPLDKLIEGFGVPPGNAKGDVKLYFGGPVAPDSLYVLHSSDWQGKTTFGVDGGLAVTATPEVLKAIADGKGPKHYLIIVGYSGWGPGQLEREMTRQGWQTAPADPKLIFDNNDATKWERVWAKTGITL